jgi:hypothetical protein
MAQATTGIELRAKVFPLALLLYLFKPRVEIDGQTFAAKWGTQFFPAAPGSHLVKVYFNYLFGPANRAEAQLSLTPGQVMVVTYKTRWLVFLPGKIDVTAWVPPPAS